MERPAPSGIAPFVGHGGRIDRARAAYPQVRDWIDLSTGVAPWAYPVDLGAVALTPLPDPALLTALEVRAAAAFGTTPDALAAVSGSDMALRLLGRILPGPAGWIAPGYSGHRTMWPDRTGRALRRDTIEEDAAGLRTVVLARPNNPDGWIADAAMLARIAERLAANDGHLVVDEAFVDATPDIALAACGWPGLVVLRSFGKFFGLAGVRLGFVVAPPAIVAALRDLIGDWPLSTPALSIGIAAYADTGWQAAQRVRLDGAARRMAALLDRHGIATVAQTAFYTLVTTARRDALFVHLAHAGLLTRPFADAQDWLRIGLPADEDGWGRLDTALTTWSA